MTAPYPVSKAASLPDFQNGNDTVARPVAPPAEPAQQKPTPRRSGRCRRIECSSYGPFGPDQRSFKTDVNFSNTLCLLSGKEVHCHHHTDKNDESAQEYLRQALGNPRTAVSSDDTGCSYDQSLEPKDFACCNKNNDCESVKSSGEDDL